MTTNTSWDFREKDELLLSSIYEKDGYIVQSADKKYLELLKKDIECAFCEFTKF